MAPNRQGMRIRGMVTANMGLKQLDMALALLGSSSEEGQAILKALSALSKIFSAPRSPDFGNAEMKLMGARQGAMGPSPQPGGMAPGMAVQNRLRSLGMGGGPPGAQ